MIDNDILGMFDTVSLEEMKKVRLMNRTDTKYVADIDRIKNLLRLLVTDYRIQQIEGIVNLPYYTRYFDTEDVNMFYEHQRGKKNRQKIRIRIYEGSDTEPFVEIKTKNNKGRTDKKRVKMDKGQDIGLYHAFLSSHSNYDPGSLVPQIENHFYRITLVNREMTERITIDTGLEFHNLLTGKRVTFDKIGIIECKRDGRYNKSGLGDALRVLRIHPCGFSKYCMGMAVTNPDLRQNRIKQRLRMINRQNG